MNELIKQIERLTKRLIGLETKEVRFSAVVLVDGITAPSAITGKALIYIDTADGDLKVKFGDGTVKTIATDT
jgi:hypothetical protein